ncbi:MAG TPA: TIGR00299 family protein, partial [Clostridiaceae bacterium]|nr:TIGR00299 family protein [Clostridiaceae bacterium]
MSILYFDCFSGISGDMTVGALIDIGVPQEYILNNLSLLNINDEYEIEIKKGVK